MTIATFAADELLPLVYDELKHLAAHRMSHEKPGQTLQTTDLVHEAYLRLVGDEQDRRWDSRGHFFAAAAEVMRRILIEQARHKKSHRAGGELKRVDICGAEPAIDDPEFDILALDEVLQKFGRTHPRKAKLVKLRFFAGLTIDQSAQVLGIAPSTANEDWVYATCWLQLELSDAD